MKKVIFLILIALFVFSCTNNEDNTQSKLRNGDIIFAQYGIPHMKPIDSLTKDSYNHCGILLSIRDTFYVYEAGGKVELTPLPRWLSRKLKDTLFVIKRLKPELQDDENAIKLVEECKKYKNLRNDVYFSWDDSAMYSSEFIWKLYKRALGIELTSPKQMKDWDYRNKFVAQRLKKQYNFDFPADSNDTVVSVEDIMNSDKLEVVTSDWYDLPGYKESMERLKVLKMKKDSLMKIKMDSIKKIKDTVEVKK